MTIARTTSGLLFRDDFDRGDSGVVGGTPAWTENDASYEISGNKLYDNQATWSNVFMYQTAGVPAARHGFILQANMQSKVGRFHGIGVFNSVAQADSSIYCGFSGNGGNWEATRIEGGANQAQDLDATLPSVTDSWYGVRMMITQNGSNIDVACLGTAALSSSSDLTKVFAESGAALTNQPYPTAGDYHGPTKWNSDNWLDEYILMGNENGGAIVMTGLPTGYKLQIGSEAGVAESSGTATIPMSTWKTYAYPEATINVLDSGDNVVESFSTWDDGGAWGGDVYTFEETVGGGGLTIDYQLTVYGVDDVAILSPRAGAAHSDDFVVTTATDWSGAQIMNHPKGRRGQLDILTGVTDTGGLSIELLDAKEGTSGGNAIRWVTAFVGDAENIAQMCGLKVLIKERITDASGTTTADFFTGRIDALTLTTKNKLTLKLQDMASDLGYKVFTGVFLGESNLYKAKAAPEMNSGEAAYASYGSRPALAPLGLIDRDEEEGGTEDYGAFVTTPWMKGTWTEDGDNRYIVVDKEHTAAALRLVTDAWPGVSGDPRAFGRGIATRNPKLRVRVMRDGDSSYGDFHWGSISVEFTGVDAIINDVVSDFVTDGGLGGGELSRVPIEEIHTDDADYKAKADFSNDDAVHLYVYSIADPTKGSPIYINDVHPITLFKDILDGKWGTINIDGTARRAFPYDSTSFTALEADGTLKTGRWIINKPASINDWVEKNICKPFQIGYRLNGSGEVVVFRTTRPVAATIAAVETIAAGDVVADANSGWTQSRKEAITLLTYKATEEIGPTSRNDTGGDGTLAAVVEAAIEYLGMGANILTPVIEHENSVTYILAENDNLKTKGIKEHEVKLTGFHTGFNRYEINTFGVHLTWAEAARAWADRHKETIKAFFSHGPIYYNATCLRTDNTNDCHPGDWRILSIPDQLDPANAQRGGARAALCLERAERGLMIDFTFLDAGPDASSTAPALNNLAAGTDTNHWVDVAIDYSGFGAGDWRVVVEYALTDTATGTLPTDNSGAWNYAFNHTATAADGVETLTIKNLPSNTRVWIRARTEPADTSVLPSAWVYPGNDKIDTVAYTPPSSITVDVASYGGGVVGVTVALGETTLETVLSLGEGTCPAGSYETIKTLLPAANIHIMAGTAVSTTYCMRAVHRDIYGGETSAATQQFTTGGTKNTAPVMADVTIVFSD